MDKMIQQNIFEHEFYLSVWIKCMSSTGKLCWIYLYWNEEIFIIDDMKIFTDVKVDNWTCAGHWEYLESLDLTEMSINAWSWLRWICIIPKASSQKKKMIVPIINLRLCWNDLLNKIWTFPNIAQFFSSNWNYIANHEYVRMKKKISM